MSSDSLESSRQRPTNRATCAASRKLLCSDMSTQPMPCSRAIRAMSERLLLLSYENDECTWSRHFTTTALPRPAHLRMTVCRPAQELRHEKVARLAERGQRIGEAEVVRRPSARPRSDRGERAEPRRYGPPQPRGRPLNAAIR